MTCRSTSVRLCLPDHGQGSLFQLHPQYIKVTRTTPKGPRILGAKAIS